MAAAVTGHRPVYFRDAGFVSTPCYARGGLAPGMVFEGPAIIEQDDTTTLLTPGWQCQVDTLGNLAQSSTGWRWSGLAPGAKVESLRVVDSGGNVTCEAHMI